MYAAHKPSADTSFHDVSEQNLCESNGENASCYSNYENSLSVGSSYNLLYDTSG